MRYKVTCFHSKSKFVTELTQESLEETQEAIHNNENRFITFRDDNDTQHIINLNQIIVIDISRIEE